MTTQENFAELFEQSIAHVCLESGKVIKAQIMDLKPGRVVVNAGLKSDAFIPAEEFDQLPIVGDIVDVYIEAVDNGYGETKLSRQKAKRAAAWAELEGYKDDNTNVTGQIMERVKGGFTVNLGHISAFLPGSLVDVKPLRDTTFLEGKDLEFRVIKMDEKRNNVVVSRRAALESENSADRQALLDSLQEGQEVIGVVKNITDYGAFVDLGGADGLLHITDMAWKRVKHPSEVLTVGEEIKVKVLRYDRAKNRVSLGLKQLGEDPWGNIARRYTVGTRTFGRITNVTDYGCFVEIEDGVEGLVHMSEMDWTNKNVHPSKVVQPNDEVEVMVLEINEERRRISLGIKQCKDNPWESFSSRFAKNDKVKGSIRSITDFGIFVGLEGGIDGLIHLSDIAWDKDGEEAVRNYSKGDELEAVILAIDSERERISLGIKQLSEDPLVGASNAHPAGSIVIATVKEVSQRHAVMALPGDLTAVMRASELHMDKVENLADEIKVGEEIEVKVLPADKRSRDLQVSHKACLRQNLADANTANVTDKSATLGDLLKEQMGGSK